MKMRIPIVMLSDENYISPTRVAIWTMRKSTCEDVLLDITVLCSDELGENARYRLQELENILTNVKISFYEVDTKIFDLAKPVEHIPIASFYRLIIGEALTEDKCLFLDGDIIVNVDLQELYLQDVEDFYLAGVRDVGFLFNPEQAIRHRDLYGFSQIRGYVNAGIMIFNLAKLRQDCLQKRFLDEAKTFYQYMDQDILNKVCEGKIKHLDLKYNFLNKFRYEDIIKVEKDFSEKMILHFTGSYKPWNNYRIRGAKEWWRWAKEALEEEEYNRLYAHAVKTTDQNDWSYIVDHCAEEETVIVIGYSQIGMDVYKALTGCKITSNIYICDNSENKRSLGGENIIIYSLEELAERHPNALWVNTSQRHNIEINRQLMGLGVKEDKILIYKKKPVQYLELLDDEYIEYELQQMGLEIMGNNRLDRRTK